MAIISPHNLSVSTQAQQHKFAVDGLAVDEVVRPNVLRAKASTRADVAMLLCDNATMGRRNINWLVRP